MKKKNRKKIMADSFVIPSSRRLFRVFTAIFGSSSAEEGCTGTVYLEILRIPSLLRMESLLDRFPSEVLL